MPTVLLGEFEDSFVIYFGSKEPRINAYTLASALMHLADAAKAANASINPGYDVEVLVEALGGGSFKAKIRTVYEGAANLFSKESCRAIVLSVIASFIYQHTLAPNAEINVTVGTNEVVIQQGETKIVVPREVHDATLEAERSPRFRGGVSDAMRALEADENVLSLGFSRESLDVPPTLEVPRDRFAILPSYLAESVSDTRELLEITEVQILRAILERSRRRWEFAWNGVRISAPLLDQAFYDRFFAHEITIAPGDKLRVRLRVKQRKAPGLGVFVNEGYEVVEVLNHLPRARQQGIDAPSPGS